MSIAKKREKTATNDSPQEKNFSALYLVSEEDMLDFIGSLGILDVDAAASRIQVIADLTADADSLDEAGIKRIRKLIRESKNEHYRRIVRAMIAAMEQGPDGIKSAHLTASYIIEKAFRWTREFSTVLSMYKDKLRRIKQRAESNNRISSMRKIVER